MAPRKVLITGASGYIGGSVLAELCTQQIETGVQLSALVRSAAHRDAVRAIGITPIHFEGLQDLEAIRKAASAHDIVVSCASAMDEPSCLALVEGLGERKRRSSDPVLYIHTSGTSNFGDHAISGEEVNLSVRSDEDDIYSWESETADKWILRKVDVAITDAGERLNVKTVIVNPPLIYGTGTGPVNQRSLQVPALVKLALHAKHALVLGKGEGLWTTIHIADVATFYALLVQRFVAGAHFQTGKQGYYFVEAGETSWLQISQAIAKAGAEQGLLSGAVKSITPQQMNDMLKIPFLNAWMIEVIWGSK
jgi:nucleoside-diphosphate-sugar epimerase